MNGAQHRTCTCQGVVACKLAHADVVPANHGITLALLVAAQVVRTHRVALTGEENSLARGGVGWGEGCVCVCWVRGGLMRRTSVSWQ